MTDRIDNLADDPRGDADPHHRCAARIGVGGLDRAEHMAQWWGPHHFTNPVCEIDVRPGGNGSSI